MLESGRARRSPSRSRGDDAQPRQMRGSHHLVLSWRAGQVVGEGRCALRRRLYARARSALSPADRRRWSKTLWPRRAMAAARLIAVVVLPTPHLLTATARTRPTLGGSGASCPNPRGPPRRCAATRASSFACCTQRSASGCWRFGQERVQVPLCAAAIAALEQHEGQTVIRAGEIGFDVERAAVIADCFFGRCVLVNAMAISGESWCRSDVAQGELVRRQRRVRNPPAAPTPLLRSGNRGVWGFGAPSDFPPVQATPPGHATLGGIGDDYQPKWGSPEERRGLRQSYPVQPTRATAVILSDAKDLPAASCFHALTVTGSLRHVATSPRTSSTRRAFSRWIGPLFGELVAAAWRYAWRGHTTPKSSWALRRPGVVPGAVIAAILGREFHSMVVSRRFGGDTVRETPTVLSAAPQSVRGKRVLVVDETCDNWRHDSPGGRVHGQCRRRRSAHGRRHFRTDHTFLSFTRWRPRARSCCSWDREVLIDGDLLPQSAICGGR